MHNHLKGLCTKDCIHSDMQNTHNNPIYCICYTSTQSWSKVQSVLVLTLTVSSIGTQNETHVAVT